MGIERLHREREKGERGGSIGGCKIGTDGTGNF